MSSAGKSFAWEGPGKEGEVILKGELNASSSSVNLFAGALLGSGEKRLRLDPGGLSALDLNGCAVLLNLLEKLRRNGVEAELGAFPAGLAPIWDLARKTAEAAADAAVPESLGFFESAGKAACDVFSDLAGLVSFLGECCVYGFRLFLRPWTGRWGVTLSIIESAVVDALPVTALVAFLVGLILAFQSAMVMQIFGVDIFVADLVGIAIIRELGALLTAIVLTGRSGSAFSSELASMKSNQEIDAMVTMGLSPVRDLAIPRVVALTLATPLLTVLADMAGLAGGNVVMMGIGHPAAVFWKELVLHVDISDILTGFFKSFVFGFTVAVIGCERGLSAGDGPSAVGEATTHGVVTNIIAIAVLDSLFAVMFYVLGW
ncbi:MAG: ABC transporter permease [Deltaproteobacteria bacterium]|jgi:phospholipid/cholesterol/gamma-HCH transport system permease protein|nr:ABC transporter permease [Deltaproteobacteria bacterium]